jgi:hypothetical protein
LKRKSGRALKFDCENRGGDVDKMKDIYIYEIILLAFEITSKLEEDNYRIALREREYIYDIGSNGVGP